MHAGLDNLTELGFGVFIGILIAGYVMAPVLIPALSTIEGPAFWWPRHARPPERRRTPAPEQEPAPAQLV
jgi:RND superfamily putative drug exporter